MSAPRADAGGDAHAPRLPQLLVAVVLSLAALPAAAVERRDVAVDCELAEHRYRLGLTAAQIAAIETDCGRLVAGQLAARYRFVDFTAGEPRPNRLVVRVGKSAAEADPNAFRAVDLQIRVEGDNVSGTGEPVSWPFRTLDEFLQVPAADAFADAIAIRFAAELGRSGAHLVKAQLGRIRLADSAYPMPDDQSWLLPFARGELGIADDSQFTIRAELETRASRERFTYSVALFGDFGAAAGVPPEFHHKVKALHLRDDKLEQASSLARLRAAERVDVLEVTLLHYVPAVEPGRTAPTDLDLE